MFKMISGVLMGILSFPRRLRRGVFRRAMVVDRPPAARACGGMRYAKDDRGRVAIKGQETSSDSSFGVTMFDAYSRTVDAYSRTATGDYLDFSAFDVALTAIDPDTGKLFNARITDDGSLGLDSLADAYSEIEKHDLRVTTLFMNVREYIDIRKLGQFEPTTRKTLLSCGLMAMLWQAEIIVSRFVPVGTVYVCADRVGVIPEGRGFADICIHNPRGIASVTVERELLV